MGDVQGFLKHGRELPTRRPVPVRIKDWKEVYEPFAEGKLETQASRCMDCGIPFCNNGCPLGNLIPDWNDLVYRDLWRDAVERLHATNNFPEFTVQSKLINPVWVKPDWAFIEEGLAVPRSQADRIEPGVLGEYALGFGKGYFIHGTLYTRLLGKNVTHGCIRLNDEDLKSVYQLAKVGTPIMIF